MRDTNRAAWIDSLIKFMTKYKFDGVDLDWEFPGDPVRGGEEGDTENYSKLVKELREAFKAKKLDWGISLAIGIDAQGVNMTAMTPYVDFFNWMSYDLHASSVSTSPPLPSYCIPTDQHPTLPARSSPWKKPSASPYKHHRDRSAPQKPLG